MRTVQSVLEDAFSKYFKALIKITASGRTDTGVHARGQVCSFILPDTDLLKDSPLSNAEKILNDSNKLYKACAAINAFLPKDVAVRDFEAKQTFHAQFDAKSKTYIYRCYISPHRSPLRADTHLQLYKKPNIEIMKAAANMLLGTHDFTSFASEQTDKTNFMRTIYCLNIEEQGDEILFTVSGNGFLRNMVRIIVGTLLDVGSGKISLISFRNAIDFKDRKLCGKTAPAHGLTLESVEY